MPNKIVFIGGMGRSGTHYLGRILGEHPQTILRLESKFTFKSITQYVVFRGERHRLLVWLALAYLKIKSMLTQKQIIEKLILPFGSKTKSTSFLLKPSGFVWFETHTRPSQA